MRPVESSIVIDRAVEVCFPDLADLGNDVEWRREWVVAEKTSAGPVGVGARYRLTAEVLGRPAATVYETVACEPSGLAAWKTASGPLPLTFSRAFERVEGSPRQLEGDYPTLM